MTNDERINAFVQEYMHYCADTIRFNIAPASFMAWLRGKVAELREGDAVVLDVEYQLAEALGLREVTA